LAVRPENGQGGVVPVIDPQGLFDGERLAACSDKAKLFWPFIYCASNGFARLEINPRHIQKKCFASFTETPTEDDIIKAIEEYAQNFLLVVYEHEGRQWVQFDTSSKYLPRHKSKKDDESPVPPPESLKMHSEGYIGWKKAKSLCLQHSRKLSETFETLRKISHGIGGGIGVGIGTGVGVGSENRIPLETTFEDKDTDMNPVREIPKISENILGVEVKIYPSDATRVKELTAVHGGTRVTNDYTEWCHEHVGVYSRPLPEYLKVASDRLRGAVSPAMDKAVVDATREMTYISGNMVLFNDRQKATISRLIQDGNSVEELEGAFKEFFQKMDTSNPKNYEFAAKNFIEAADAMCYTRRKQQHVRLSEQAAADRAREVMVAESVSDREVRRKAREAEEALIEDVLE
jgi:hypothetical protein